MSKFTFPAGDGPQPGSIDQSFWRDTVAAFAAGGQSARAFCQERGLCLPTFYAWRARLADHRSTPAASAPARSDRPAFLPVLIEPRAEAGESIQVELRGGRVLRLPASMPAGRLAEVLHALEGQA